MLDPIRFRKTLVLLLKILIAIEILDAISDGFSGNGWTRLGFDCILAGGLYVMWDRIKAALPRKREEIRLRFESSTEQLKLWDALLFSLLWSDEIYLRIPRDRQRLVLVSYTLIAIGIGVVFLDVGSGLMPLVMSGALVLAAVNLLVWVVGSERGERESLQTEFKLAHDVQLSLMPREHPNVEGFDIVGTSIPAKEVGGDHFNYDLEEVASGKVGISVFDVSGKGMQAAMSAVFTTGAYLSDSRQYTSPAQLLTSLNKAVFRHSRRGHFVSSLVALLDGRNKTITFSNAGQSKPLLRSNGTVSCVEANGVRFPLGMQGETEYEQRTLRLHSGDVVLLMTDGIVEAMNPQRQLYGGERLTDIVAGLAIDRLSAQEILDNIVEDVREHIGSASQHDDMTLVVIKVR